MIVSHELPAGWVDTGEADKIQPSAVAGLVHVVTLEPEDVELLRGPAGLQGPEGPAGPAGDQGPAGQAGPAGPATQSVLPAGMVGHFRRKVAPPGWLAMVGVGVLVADYPELVAACYVGDADNATAEGFYRCNAADGSGRNVAGAYLFVEDARGDFIRGWDSRQARKLGDVQGDAIRNITGSMVMHGSGEGSVLAAATGALVGYGWRGAYRSAGATLGGAGSYDGLYFDASAMVPTAAENRPRNRSYLMCVSTGKAV